MADPVATPDYRYRSPFTWLAAFWVALTLPRLWYLARSGVMFTDGAVTLQILRVGFVRDGVLVGGLAFVVQICRRMLARSHPRAYARFLTGLLWAMTIALAFSMLNGEVLHQAGTPLEFEYFRLMTDSREGPLLFITNKSAVAILLLQFVVVPVVFRRFCHRVRLLRFDLFMASPIALLLSLSMIFAGVSALNERLSDETRALVANDYVLSLFRQAVTHQRDISEKGGDIRTTLLQAPDPLPKPGEKPQPWYFVDPQYPLIKATAHQLCQAGVWTGKPCQEDHDGDGYPVQTDCNDYDAAIHPGAVDIPRDGIDQDCSGLDADPPNVIFIHFESARACNFGCLNGYKRHSTPRFDKLAEKGILFTNAYCNGIQTRYSIVPMYCSTLDRMSHQWICRYNPKLELLSIPGVLRGRGYDTIYIHGGDNNFSSHSARLWQWFEDVYDKAREPFRGAKRFNWGLKDKDLFALTYDLLKKRTDKRPFYCAIATLSLHFPMGLPDPAYEYVPNDSYDNKVSNILRYADDALGDFIEKIQADPQFENTIILVAADHGINGGVPTVLDEDVVWVPILLTGKNWNLPPQRIDEVRQLSDLGPTVLDRLGIEVPNPFIGHSLLRRFPEGRVPKAFFSTANGGAAGGMREGNFKYWTRFETGDEYFYDLSKDREGKHNLAHDSKYAAHMAEMFKEVKTVWGGNNNLIQTNRIWNYKYWGRRP